MAWAFWFGGVGMEAGGWEGLQEGNLNRMGWEVGSPVGPSRLDYERIKGWCQELAMDMKSRLIGESNGTRTMPFLPGQGCLSLQQDHKG